MRKLIKYAFYASVMFISTACYMEKKVYNREVETEKYGKMLLGRQTKSQLSKAPFNEWYDQEYNEYEYDSQIIKELSKNKISSYNIVVFFGTWCGDTKRELPRLLKVLDAVKYPEQKLNLVAVNRKKETPDGEDVPYNIQRVPTIVVKKYGREVGRITESPQSGFMEKDLLDILKKKK